MEDDLLRVVIKAKEIRDLRYPECPYVCNIEGRPFHDLRHAWNVACNRVGLEGRIFHDLRRTGVRNLIRAGVPETIAMKITGHKTRSVFDRYDITSEGDVKRAATQLSSYIQAKKVTIPVTLAQYEHAFSVPAVSQPL